MPHGHRCTTEDSAKQHTWREGAVRPFAAVWEIPLIHHSTHCWLLTLSQVPATNKPELLCKDWKGFSLWWELHWAGDWDYRPKKKEKGIIGLWVTPQCCLFLCSKWWLGQTGVLLKKTVVFILHWSWNKMVLPSSIFYKTVFCFCFVFPPLILNDLGAMSPNPTAKNIF